MAYCRQPVMCPAADGSPEVFLSLPPLVKSSAGERSGCDPQAEAQLNPSS